MGALGSRRGGHGQVGGALSGSRRAGRRARPWGYQAPHGRRRTCAHSAIAQLLQCTGARVGRGGIIYLHQPIIIAHNVQSAARATARDPSSSDSPSHHAAEVALTLLRSVLVLEHKLGWLKVARPPAPFGRDHSACLSSSELRCLHVSPHYDVLLVRMLVCMRTSLCEGVLDCPLAPGPKSGVGIPGKKYWRAPIGSG